MPSRSICLSRLQKYSETKTGAFSLNDPGTNNRVKVNPTRTCHKIQVDGKLMEIQPKRCDWCIRDPELGECLFIELKGQHWSHGIAQIEYTIRWFRKNISHFSIFKECYIIMSGGIPSNDTKSQQEKIRFMRNYKTQLIMRHSGITITF